MRETTSYLNNQNRFLTKTNQDLNLKINLLTHMNKQIRWKLNIGDEDDLENEMIENLDGSLDPSFKKE